jgi:hypothetical protein
MYDAMAHARDAGLVYARVVLEDVEEVRKRGGVVGDGGGLGVDRRRVEGEGARR